MKKSSIIFILLFLVSSSVHAIVISTLSQSKYRWRNNDGNETTATWAAAVNTPYTLTNVNDTLRLRTEYNSVGSTNTVGHYMAYSKDGGTTWRTINESDTNDFKMTTSTLVAHNTPTTNQFGTSTGGTYFAGYIASQNTPGNGISIPSSNRAEMEWVIKPTILCENNKTYLFESRSVSATGQRAVLNTSFICNTPTLNPVANINRCGNGSVVLNASTVEVGGNVLWWTAATGGNLIGIGTGLNSPPYNTNTTVYVQAYKDGCLSARTPVNIFIRAIPTVNLGLDKDTCVLSNETITLNPGTQEANSTFLWDDGSSNSTRIVNQNGTYYVKVTNQYGCVNTDTINVITKEKPEVNISTGNNLSTICIGATQTLDAGSAGLNGGNYYWNNGEQTKTITINQGGTYSVNVTNAIGCSNSDTIIITEAGHAPSLGAIMPQPITSDSFNFLLFNPENIIEYIWDFGDGSPNSTTMEPSHKYLSSGTFLIRLKYKSTCAEAIDSTYVHIIGLGVNDRKNNEKSIMVFPNPNKTGKVNIVSNNEKTTINEVIIYNSIGQEVTSSKAKNNNQKDLEIILPNSVVSGIYFIKINTNSGIINKQLQILK